MDKNQTTTGQTSQSRRSFLGRVAVGSLLLGLAGQAFAYLRSLVPNVLYEVPRRFKIGRPSELSEPNKASR